MLTGDYIDALPHRRLHPRLAPRLTTTLTGDRFDALAHRLPHLSWATTLTPTPLTTTLTSSPCRRLFMRCATTLTPTLIGDYLDAIAYRRVHPRLATTSTPTLIDDYIDVRDRVYISTECPASQPLVGVLPGDTPRRRTPHVQTAWLNSACSKSLCITPPRRRRTAHTAAEHSDECRLFFGWLAN